MNRTRPNEQNQGMLFRRSLAPTRPPPGSVSMWFDAKTAQFRYIAADGSTYDVAQQSVPRPIRTTILPAGHSLVVSRRFEIADGATFEIGPDADLEIL